MVIRDPDSAKGQIFRVWGQVVQYDTRTGLDIFHANIAERNTLRYSYFSGERAQMQGTAEMFADFIEDDLFVATVEVVGTYSYSTAIGGRNTVPVFDVLVIERR